MSFSLMRFSGQELGRLMGAIADQPVGETRHTPLVLFQHQLCIKKGLDGSIDIDR